MKKTLVSQFTHIYYRPVALTSQIMNTPEQMLLSLLRLQVKNKLDPLQSAYKGHIRVSDAVLSIVISLI